MFATLEDKIRPLWRTYTRNTDAIIFVLDSADYRSFDQARAGAELDNNTIVRETLGISASKRSIRRFVITEKAPTCIVS